MAAERSKHDIAELLIRSGTDVNAKDKVSPMPFLVHLHVNLIRVILGWDDTFA